MEALDLPIAFHTVDDVLLRGLQFGRTLELSTIYWCNLNKCMRSFRYLNFSVPWNYGCDEWITSIFWRCLQALRDHWNACAPASNPRSSLWHLRTSRWYHSSDWGVIPLRARLLLSWHFCVAMDGWQDWKTKYTLMNWIEIRIRQKSSLFALDRIKKSVDIW